ncbi:hypothetical protein KUCAC02_022601 [Chaenocephalus aceratus]|uniref:Uncharacterized protein n=1 Tax=Chaenocephalus aceratus TaxID=36190 RepID=A0ACB9XPK4_CHAAC|nr:hypothetical protein KUCAC02_022601 [Chaenocephalus aceratus]
MAGLELEEDKGVSDERETEHSAGKLETVPPISTEQVKHILIGRMKGIQGHCNSCYMDAALFSLFSCSSVLDSMLFKSTEPQDAPIQRTLLQDIVNPLRSKGFVEGRHIMKLRQQLQKHGYSHSFTTDEKDPEEFLTVIMHHILLWILYSNSQQENRLLLPTVQQLLEHSFHTAALKLADDLLISWNKCLALGRKFKMFDKIIPSLELDITDLLCEGPQQCMLCGDLAELECSDCFKESLFSHTGFQNILREVFNSGALSPSAQVPSTHRTGYSQGLPGQQQNSHSDQRQAGAVRCALHRDQPLRVLHQTRTNSNDWIFFDSMADRQGESDGFNIPEVHACPEVGTYLEMSIAELANQVPRDMKGVAKRLFCDAYMYLYQSPSMCLYR